MHVFVSELLRSATVESDSESVRIPITLQMLSILQQAFCYFGNATCAIQLGDRERDFILWSRNIFKQYIFGYNNKHRILETYIATHLCVRYTVNKRLYLFDGILAENTKFKINYLEPADVTELKALLGFVVESCANVEYADGADMYPGVKFRFTLGALKSCVKRLVNIQLKQSFTNYLVQPTR